MNKWSAWSGDYTVLVLETFNLRYYNKDTAAVDWPLGWRLRRRGAGLRMPELRLATVETLAARFGTCAYWKFIPCLKIHMTSGRAGLQRIPWYIWWGRGLVIRD